MSPAARMLAFVLLLVAMFAVAYAVGAQLGPITLSHQQPGAHMRMPMGAGGTRASLPWPPSARD